MQDTQLAANNLRCLGERFHVSFEQNICRLRVLKFLETRSSN